MGVNYRADLSGSKERVSISRCGMQDSAVPAAHLEIWLVAFCSTFERKRI